MSDQETGPAFAHRLFDVIYDEAKEDPRHNFPNVFEHGQQMGREAGDVVQAVQMLTDLGWIRWKTNAWVELTARGIAEGRRRRTNRGDS